MFAWNPNPLRARSDEVVRRWADLEGKSESMRADLYREHALRPMPSAKPRVRISVLGELILAALEAWWHVRSR
jgi:hypothetical protein